MYPEGRQICRFSPVTSDDLIEQFRLSNRAEDFEQIVRRFAALVLCECRRVTGNVYDAEDASQLVFLALAMEIKSGTDIQSLGAWLKRVSHRQALKIVRSRTRRKRREDAVRRSELEHVDTDSPLDQSVIAGIIRDAIDQLPERYRLAVILHYFGGMTLELIAVELKISKQAVGTRLHRGRKMLGEKLAQRGMRLDEHAMVAALGVLVPAAVVSAIVRASSTAPYHAGAAAAVPGMVTHLLNVIGISSASYRPLRLAALAAAMMIGTSGLAMIADPHLRSLRQIVPSAAAKSIKRALQPSLPQFRAPSLSPLSSANDLQSNVILPMVSPVNSDRVQAAQQLAELPVMHGSTGPLAYPPAVIGPPLHVAPSAPLIATYVEASSAAASSRPPVDIPQRASGGARGWASSDSSRTTIAPKLEAISLPILAGASKHGRVVDSPTDTTMPIKPVDTAPVCIADSGVRDSGYLLDLSKTGQLCSGLAPINFAGAIPVSMTDLDDLTSGNDCIDWGVRTFPASEQQPDLTPAPTPFQSRAARYYWPLPELG